jgi:hypothetical protein
MLIVLSVPDYYIHYYFFAMKYRYSSIESTIPKTIFSTSISEKNGEFGILILAVKPQDFSVLVQSITPYQKIAISLKSSFGCPSF